MGHEVDSLEIQNHDFWSLTGRGAEQRVSKEKSTGYENEADSDAHPQSEDRPEGTFFGKT